MVRDMAFYEHKEFLNFNDFKQYLIDKKVSDARIVVDNERLFEFILDLIDEDKLRGVFSYRGSGHFEYLDDNNQEKIYDSLLLEGYFCLYKIQLQRIFEVNELDVLGLSFKPYKLNDVDRLSKFIGHDIYKNENLSTILFDKKIGSIKPKISIENIRFIKSDLDKLFNQQPQANNDELAQQLQATIDSQVKEIADLKAQLEQQATQPSDTATDEKNPLKDIRTQNNLIRLLLAVNEMAKDKKGQSLDYSKDYNKENLQAINKKLDLLDYTNIGEAAFTTLATLIREKQGKGL